MSEGTPENEEEFQIPPRVLPVDRLNRIDLVAYYFCRGKTVPQIARILEQDHGIKDISREQPYHDLAFAASHQWLSYHPPPMAALAQKVRSRFPYLLRAEIPNWGGRMAVVSVGAKLVSDSIYGIARKLAEEYAIDWGFPVDMPKPEPRRSRLKLPGSDDQEKWWGGKDQAGERSDNPQPVPMELEVRIGVSGGDTMGKTAGELGRTLEPLLADWERELRDLVFETLEKKGKKDQVPSGKIKRRFRVKIRLLFINLVTGFDTNADSHPIAFLTSMIQNNGMLSSRASIMCFSSAPFVPIGQREQIIEESYVSKKIKRFIDTYGLDIILTSAGALEDGDSTFRRYYRQGAGESGEQFTYQTLKRLGVEGDILWQPITRKRALRLRDKLSGDEIERLKYRPMTLLSLEELIAHKTAGRDVFLVLGPCGKCNETKEQVLKAILEQEEPMVSHYIGDRDSTARMLGIGIADEP